jgi:pimeloyl-ACP methyl ester carboxylesterase
MPTVTSRDGTRIGYDSKGSGPTLILVAGATQYRAVDQTTPVMAGLLASRFTVINYDRRGRGESGDTAPYAVAREIEDIEALIDDHGGPCGALRHVLRRGAGAGGSGRLARESHGRGDV